MQPTYRLHNAFVDLPENEQKRIIQKMTDLTKINAYKECLVPGAHSGKIVEGHVIQKAVQRRLTHTNDVVSIVKRPMIALRSGSPSSTFFVPTSLNHAVTGYFTCEKHEAEFRPIEQGEPDFSNPIHNTLFAYKGVLFQAWVNKAMKRMWEAMASEDPRSDLPQFFCKWHDRMENELEYYKTRIEADIGISTTIKGDGNGSRFVHHAVFEISTESPIIAVSEWERGNRQGGRINPGITVYPTDDKHIVAIHYLAEEKERMRRYLWPLEEVTEVVLQRRISRYILGDYENVVISPDVWDSWAQEKQTALKDYFLETMPDVGLEFEDRPGAPRNTSPGDTWHSKRLRLINFFSP